MALSLTNITANVLLFDGIEFSPNTPYILSLEEQGTLLQDVDLALAFTLNQIVLEDSIYPTISFSGATALLDWENHKVASNAVLLSQINDINTAITALDFAPTNHFHNTDQITEASNLYFTPTRVANTAVVQSIHTSLQTLNTLINSHSHTTAEIPENTNLYYTDGRVEANPEVVALRADLSNLEGIHQWGDVGAGDYTEFDSITGKISFHGLSRPWKNILCSFSTESESAPFLGLLKNTGIQYLDKGLQFDSKQKQYISIPSSNDFSFHHQSFSVAFWIEPHEEDSYIITKSGEVWAIELKGKRVKVDLKNNGSLKSEKKLKWKQRNHVAVTLFDNEESIKIKIYINGEFDETVTFNNQITDVYNQEIYIGCESPGENHFDGVLDDLRFWNTALVQTDIDELYNAGNGTQIAVAPTDALVMYSMNEGTGNTSLGIPNLPHYELNFPTGQEPTWTDGLLLDLGESVGGINCPWFLSTKSEELFAKIFIDHSYAEETDLPLRVKLVSENIASGTVSFGIEYLWINESGTIPSSTIVTQEKVVQSNTAFTYFDLNFSDIPGVGKQKNSILLLRLFRNTRSGADTYPSAIGFLGCNVKYLQDQL